MNFVPEPSGSNLFLGLEWPTMPPHLNFQEHIDNNLNETILIGDRIANIQHNLIGEGILLDDSLMMSQPGAGEQNGDEIAIDPDLLTLKPPRQNHNLDETT